MRFRGSTPSRKHGKVVSSPFSILKPLLKPSVKYNKLLWRISGVNTKGFIQNNSCNEDDGIKDHNCTSRIISSRKWTFLVPLPFYKCFSRFCGSKVLHQKAISLRNNFTSSREYFKFRKWRRNPIHSHPPPLRTAVNNIKPLQVETINYALSPTRLTKLFTTL